MAALVQLNRWYSAQEICDLLHIKNDSNYSKAVKRRLDKMGVKYEYKTKKVRFLEEPQGIEERLRYLLDLKGIKVIEVRDFAIFYYCLINFEEYQYCPWRYRAEMLKDVYDCKVDDKKLTRWGKDLIDAGLLFKTTNFDKKVWMTWWDNGESHQEPVDEEDEEAMKQKQEYWELFWEKVDYYTKNPDQITETTKYGKKVKPSAQASADCRKQFGCCYYSCYNFVSCAWASDEEEQAIRDIIDTYVETVIHN